MATRPAIVDNPLDRRARLSTLGVTQEILLRAVASGEAARASCLPTHPPGAPGMYCFFETFRSLADDLLDSGWSRKDHKNFSTVLRPDGLVAIAVARGDDGTGDRDANVSTMYSKGIVTREAVERNLLLPLDARTLRTTRVKQLRSPRTSCCTRERTANSTLSCPCRDSLVAPASSRSGTRGFS